MRTFFESIRAGRASAAVSLSTLLLAAACREDRDPILPPGPELDGKEYYPVVVGQFREYNVVDHYWQLNRDSVVRYQLREEVDSAFTGAGGEPTYRIVRSTRADSTAISWRPDSTLMVVANDAFIRQTSSNRPTVELVFAIREGKSWNANQLSGADATMRHYQGVGQAFTLPGGRKFDKTVRIVDDSLVSIVSARQQEAAYAWNIGRVYRKWRAIEYCNQNDINAGTPCQIGVGYKARGRQHEEQLYNWGPR